MITQQTKSKSLFELITERVIVNFDDYFCCIHIFSAKLFICSQTFVNLKDIQKLEISNEFDVRLIFTPMYGPFTDCTKHASAAAFIRRQLTLYWLFTQTKLTSIYRNNLLSLIHVLDLDETWSVAYNLGETQTCNNVFLLFCREILESVWQEEENFEVAE